jgi:hypothetical protein
MILFGGEFAGALLQRDPSPIAESLDLLMIPFLFLSVLMHFLLLIITITLTADSLAREHKENRWDLLLLTGLDARRLVLGKWWAIVRFMWREFLLLIPMRVGLAVWIGAETSRVFIGLSTAAELVQPHPLEILLALPIIAAFTLAGLPLAAALGMWGASIFRGGAAAFITSMAGGLLTLVFTFLALYFGGLFVESGLASVTQTSPIGFSERLATSFLDNGYSLASMLATYDLNPVDASQFVFSESFPPLTTPQIILAALLGVVAYAVMTWLILLLAQRVLIRKGVSKPA